MEKPTVIFICMFNSVRSQMAEGLLRSRCAGKYSVFSAGLAPAGLNPYAVRVMKEAGIDISQQRSKSLSSFSNRTFDHVVTLCNQVACAAPHSIPQGASLHHRGFVSPSEFQKDKDEIIQEYRKLRDQIDAWITEIFPNCPTAICSSDPEESKDLSKGPVGVQNSASHQSL
jgi:arsenate reductase